MLTDADTGIGLAAATIMVLRGGTQTAVAELDGSFVLPLPPGRYEINFFTPTYGAINKTVVVKKGHATRLDVALTPAAGATEVIEVTGKIDTRSESATLAVRRSAAVVTDAISSQEIARSSAANAGDAVRRVVAVSIVDGKYVALRGLEGRYVTTLLNGVVLPSTEPDRNAVPLDLFPTQLLANLTVYKSYGVELPGQFGGGALGITTNSFPTRFELKMSFASSANTAFTGQTGLASAARGGATYFGFDDGSRQLPNSVPANQAVRNMPMDQMAQIGRAFRNEWTPSSDTVAPNFSLAATVGDTNKVRGKRVGYLASAMLRRNYVGRAGATTRTALVDGALRTTDSLTYSSGEAEATVGTLANVGLTLAPGHDLNLFGLYTHVGSDQSSTGAGFSESDASDIDMARLSFVERSLGLVQLTGQHAFPAAGKLSVKWQMNAANASRDELDSRDMVYLTDAASGMRTYKDQPGSGQRYWSFLTDKALGGGLDAELPAGRVRLRAGGAIQANDRAFRGRRFRYRWIGDDASVRNLPAEEMLDANRLGQDFALEEGTLHEDSYVAGLQVVAGYGSAEVAVAPKLKLIAGARVEAANQHLQNGSRFAIAGVQANVNRNDLDTLPAANAVYALTSNTNLRAAYSYTLTRPRFRELAPFLYFDYVRRRSISGNPNLANTRIHNADLRWEYFPSEGEVVAASTYAKVFENPIEQVLADSESNATFRNAQGGTVVGGELEAKISGSRAHAALRHFRLGTNLALMRSRVQLPAEMAILTSRNRPLFGQSPYVVNLALDYANPKIVDFAVLYNVTGRRISDVGVEGLPDTYEEPMHRLDITAARGFGHGLRARIAATNLLQQRVRYTQGGIAVDNYQPGLTVTAGLEWTPQTR